MGIFLFKIRNRLHIPEVTLRHFVGMFLKVPTLEEFKLLTDFSTSALSTPEKWKVDVIVVAACCLPDCYENT